MKMNKLAISVLMVLSTEAVPAGLGTIADQWYQNSNYTSPGTYESQSARIVSGGSLSARNPIVNVGNMMNVTPPKLSAGCGGIDINLGGFSFIDKDQIVEQLRAIGQNAQSLVFMMGIKAVSPMLEDLMSTINDWANQFNQFQTNSCQAAEAMLGGGMELMGVTGGTCIVERMNNMNEDWVTAKEMCSTGGQQKSTLAANPNASGFTLGNYTWYVLMQDQYYRDSINYAKMIMNIFGTITVIDTNPADPVAGIQLKIYPGVFRSGALSSHAQGIINTFIEGGSFAGLAGVPMYNCEDDLTSRQGCIVIDRVTLPNMTFTGLKYTILADLNGIVSKIRSDTELTASERNLVTQSGIPIYRLLSAMVASNSTDINKELEELSVKMSKYYVVKGFVDTGESVRWLASNIDNTGDPEDQPIIGDWIESLDSVNKVLQAELIRSSEDMAKYADVRDKALNYEKAIITQLPHTLVSSLKWNR